MHPKLIVKKVKNRAKFLYKLYVVRDEFSIAVHRWFRCRGDETLRLSYDLNEDSTVIDLGGYKGDFADAIYNRYGSTVYLFEPVRDFYDACDQRFASNPKIHCFNYGLSASSGQFSISAEADGSSVVKASATGGEETVRIESFAATAGDLGLTQIDLIKINIEGGEYDVLPAIIVSGWIGKIRNVQVQFHDFIPGAIEKRQKIRDDLLRTHMESWCFPFVWESWRLK
ncbi:MAG: FkbM family methyltransferase [Hyphomicrobiaceae bacterium]